MRKRNFSEVHKPLATYQTLSGLFMFFSYNWNIILFFYLYVYICQHKPGYLNKQINNKYTVFAGSSMPEN